MFLDGDRINSRAVVFPSYEDGQAYLVGYDFQTGLLTGQNFIK